MALTWAKISDEKNDLVTDIRTTYLTRPIFCSPSGNYVITIEGNGSTSNKKNYLVDTSANPPVLIWDSIFDFDDDPEIGNDGMEAYAVDDEGTVWCGDGGSDGKVFMFDKDTETMTLEYTWSQLNDDDPEAHDLVIYRIFTFTMTGGVIKSLIIPENVWNLIDPNPWSFLAVKGTPGLTNISTHSSPRAGAWGVFGAFADDNDDIWVYGHPSPRTDELVLWRITDVGGSPYDDYFSITMPVNGRDPEGYFADGKFVAAWGDSSLSTNAFLYFSVDLVTGAFDYRALEEAEVVFLSTSSVGAHSYEYAPVQNVPPNPGHYFYFADNGTQRTMRELLPDLTDGLEYSLDDWGADDGLVEGDLGSSTVLGPLYLDGPTAFCGTRRFYLDFDTEHSDFYEYYFDEESGGGGSSGDTTLRCWAFSLDGHDFYVLRVGPTATFVYDLTTDQWSSWKSPELDYLRAHVGQNWIGMTDTLDTFGTDVVGGDDTEGILWILDPTVGEDDDITTGASPFDRVVTGGLALTGRETALCNALTITLALGDPVATSPTITLRTSDDLGQTWINHGVVTLTTSNFSQVVEWFGLGLMQHPGRLFEISDSGATVRIGRAQIR